MSITNLGNQYITFDYKHPATAKDFNTLLKGAIKPGIYSGGDITITGANTISVAPFIAYLYSDTDKLVRVETRLAVALTIAESTPVLSITLPWANVAENWLDWNQRAHASAPITNEVCLGEMVFVASAIDSIDYTLKTWGKQLTSDVIDGITPMSIISETLVEHLNADLFDSAHKSIDGTFATNSDLLIPTEKAVKTYVDYAMRYDYVIDSQAKFDALVASSTWFGAKNVLFTTNVTRTAQTTIPATVEKIHAINGATLTVTDLTTGQYGFGYATVPTDPKFEVRSFAVNATGTGEIYGFNNCTRLTNCTGTGSGGDGYGFNSCTQLTGCTGTGTGGASGYGAGFNSCTQLTGCTGTGNGTGPHGNGYGFNSCTQLIGCTGTGTAGNAAADGYGYNRCKKCMCNKAGGASKTETYNESYADAGTSYACADTAAGGYNS